MSEHMVRVGTVCNPYYVDVVDFRKSNDEQPEKVEALVAVVHSGGSRITLAQYLVDKSIPSCFLPSWDAMPHRPPWPPPMQFEIESDGVLFRPMPWPLFGCLTVRYHTCFLHKYLMWLLCCEFSGEYWKLIWSLYVHKAKMMWISFAGEGCLILACLISQLGMLLHICIYCLHLYHY